LQDASYSTQDPLDLVAHDAHQERIQYFIRKVFGLSGNAILPILAPGPDHPDGILPEKALVLLTKLVFTGASSSSRLRGRQRLALMMRNPLHNWPLSGGAER
jgi:hypothetical protein